MSVVASETRQQELAAQSVNALKPDGHSGALAIIDGHSICKRATEGSRRRIATHESALGCLETVGKSIFVGTDDDTGILYLNVDGEHTRPTGFATVARRDTWYAGLGGCQRPSCGTTLGG